MKIANIRPWWLRLVVLLSLGIPAFTGWPLSHFYHSGNHPTDLIFNLSLWVGYAGVILTLIGINMGGERLAEVVSVASVLGLTTALLGGAVRRLGQFLVNNSNGGQDAVVSYKMLNILVIVLAVIPYAIFFVNCFSASKLVEAISHWTGKRRLLGTHAALAFRVVQHATEVASTLMLAWVEENPQRLLPRFRTDWKESTFGWVHFFGWFQQAILTWSFALLIHTIEPIPMFADELAKINNIQ